MIWADDKYCWKCGSPTEAKEEETGEYDRKTGEKAKVLKNYCTKNLCTEHEHVFNEEVMKPSFIGLGSVLKFRCRCGVSKDSWYY